MNHALTQLSLKVRGANPKRVKYIASNGGGIARIELLHDGRAIPAEDIESLNSSLEQIASGEKEHIGMRHGNLIAARELKQIGGRIRLENIGSGEYTVRTTVELPQSPNYGKGK